MKTLQNWIFAVALIALNTAAFACPFCKDSVPSSDAQSAGSLPNGMNNSVYLMLTAFFVVLGMIMGVVIKGVRDTNNRSGPPGFPRE
jgi:heme/copper-type cytochrome/quinol oxidase subunit 2